MKAVVTQGDGTVELADVPPPVLREEEDVIIKVTAAAVCGTDLHFIHAPILSPATPLGHEFLGVVHEVGSAVRNFAKGDRVKSRMFTSCGCCSFCLSGNQPHCPKYALFGGPGVRGGELAGGQAEYVRIPYADRTLTPIAEGLSDADALLLTDTLPTAWEAVTRAGLPAGRSYAVVGAGPVGQQIIAVAFALGAANVFAVDLNERRLETAKSLGAIPVSASPTAGAYIQDASRGGVDVAVDAVGSQSAVDTAMQSAKSGGTVALVGAFLSGELRMPVEHLFHKNLKVSPILGNPYVSEGPITSMLTSGRLSLNGLVDYEAPLTDAVDVYKAFADRKINKAVLRPG